MSDSSGLLETHARSGWIRLRTLIHLRWLALAGQSAALFIATAYLDLELQFGLCLMAVGASIIANLMATMIFPQNKRLSDSEAMLTLLFDISQLALLLYLTGGLTNPFALLILAPVTISATALRMRSTVILGLAAIVLISVVAVYHVPLHSDQGVVLSLPPLFLFGFWLAIVIGIVFEAGYAMRVTGEIDSMSQALLATQMALSREQKLTDLGGVVAAAAHELGTPLATIKLVSSELTEELTDRPALQDDARLIGEQTDRCRDILRSMGRAGKEDLHMRQAPLSAVLEEAAEPHADRGKILHFSLEPAEEATQDDADQPVIRRWPEIIHGLRNLVQNAVDFAEREVWITARWSGDKIVLRIIDDGPGFPVHLLGRIGDPFLRRRRSEGEERRRPEYEGMGLGLFIAKTLLERSGAEVSFANALDGSEPLPRAGRKKGAIAEVVWPRHKIAVEAEQAMGPLGENRPISA
jgi:two-component system sensor histidine kinase RegB